MAYGAEPASDRAKSPVQLRYVRRNPPHLIALIVVIVSVDSDAAAVWIART